MMSVVIFVLAVPWANNAANEWHEPRVEPKYEGVNEPNDIALWSTTGSADMILGLKIPNISPKEILDVTFTFDDIVQTVDYDPNDNTITFDNCSLETAFKRLFYYMSEECDPNEYLMNAKLVFDEPKAEGEYEGQLYPDNTPSHVFHGDEWRRLNYPDDGFIGVIE